MILQRICCRTGQLNAIASRSSRRWLSGQCKAGMCFDIDGVLARGLQPLPEAIEAFRLLRHPSHNRLAVPTVFLTNGFSSNTKKAKWLSDCLQTEITADQLVQAHSPLTIFESLKQLHCLVVGQGSIADIVQQDLGFKHVCTIEDICNAYPLLDVVDHEKFRACSHLPVADKNPLPLVEAIVICGEPKHWETHLQLLVDLLLTSGKPSCHSTRSYHQTLPVFACNPDLHYMARSHLPRFGNGAFLTCLEALFKKVTGEELEYSALIGKPSEITYRYADHCLKNVASKLSSSSPPLKTMYMIGDNTDVDVLGANLYQRFVQGGKVPVARALPKEAELHPQTVQDVVPILVMTGVHRAQSASTSDTSFVTSKYGQSHRYFGDCGSELYQPAVVVDNVYEAVKYVIGRESFQF